MDDELLQSIPDQQPADDEILERLRVGLADRYNVEQALGEGGMALVYLARDIKHDRQVAIKVLRPELASSLGADRFLREIQITAKLSHPHILPLYDSGEADGFLYYVMPLIEGEPLGDMLKREQQLSLEEAVQIAREVAEALSHAHSYGLIHRDIKPDNVMLSGGHAVVADFGISRAVSQAGGDQITQTGMAVGTPAYMSPEQAAGDPHLDGRTDIYALGCMLYEMLVGQIPFTGPNAQAIMARHTMDQVTPPSIMRQTVPPELEDIILCAMAKTPADRFRTANEFVEALKAIETGGTPAVRKSTMARLSTMQRVPVETPAWRRAVVPAASALGVVALGVIGWQLLGNRTPAVGAVEGGLDPKSVAILYLDDRSPNGELAHVADGLTEGLIDKLSAVRGLSVVSRNGVAPFRGSDLPRDSIARALQVGSLIAGSVEPDGDDLQISLRLVEGTSGVDFDRAQFRLAGSDLLAAQDSVIETVSRLLRRRLGEEIRLREQRAATASVEAWGLTQRANRLQKNSEEMAEGGNDDGAVAALAEADSFLALAKTADPNRPQPSIQRGWIALDRARMEHGIAGAPWVEAGIGHAERALQLAPNEPEALALRGTLRFEQYDLEVSPDPQELDRLLFAARDDLEAAVQADPSLATAHITLFYVYYQSQINDVPGALLAARTGYEQDAYLDHADDLVSRLFWGSLDLEQLNQARRWCAEGGRRFPADDRFASCQLWLMVSPAVPPDVDLAWELAAQIDTLAPAHVRGFASAQAKFLVGGILGRAELVDSAQSVLASARAMVTSQIDPDQDLVTIEALVRAQFGDYEAAIDLLKRVAAAEHGFDQAASSNWWWRELKNHPRFVEITEAGN